MVVRSVQANDFGDYICEGSNMHGTGQATVNLFGKFYGNFAKVNIILSCTIRQKSISIFTRVQLINPLLVIYWNLV